MAPYGIKYISYIIYIHHYDVSAISYEDLIYYIIYDTIFYNNMFMLVFSINIICIIYDNIYHMAAIYVYDMRHIIIIYDTYDINT